MDLEKYINAIKPLKPMNQGFMYNTKVYYQLPAERKDLLSDYEGKELKRGDIVSAYKSYFNGNGKYINAFLLTMIWGFGDTGYGAFRTNNLISTAENLQLIKRGIDLAKEDNLEIAFQSLMKIKGLGISYATKVLYFATRAAHKQEYALIFDNRVAQSLVRLYANNEIAAILNVSPSSKFEDYQHYIRLIHRLAKQHGVEADAIELFLFEQKFT